MLVLAILRIFFILASMFLFVLFVKKLSTHPLKGVVKISLGLGLFTGNFLLGAIYHSPLGNSEALRTIYPLLGKIVGYVALPLGFALFLMGVYQLVGSLRPYLDQSYQSLVENSLVGVYIIQDGVFKFVNPRLCQILGYTEGELIGKKVAELVAPPDKKEVEEKIRQRLSGEVDAIQYSFQVIRKDGQVIDVEVYGSRTIYQGEPAIHGTLLEISERKRNEAFVKKQNRLLEQIAGGSELEECLDNILHFLEAYGKGIHCSVCLVDPSETYLELKNAPSLPAEVRHAFQRINIKEENSCCVQAVLRKKSVITADISQELSGDLRKDFLLKHGYRACWSIPIFSGENRVMGTLGMYSREARYPTEIELQLVEVGVHLISIAIAKRERERQLREREKWFRSIFETSAIGILLISPEGKLIANNTSFSKLLKYSSFELAKKSLFDILHQEDRSLNINSIIKQLREDDSFYQLELRFLRKNQEIVWARCTFSLVKDEQDRPQFVVGMIEDVTSQKRAVEALHASEERYRMLFNSAMDMVVVFQLGPDQKPLNFLEVNDAACQSLGYTRNELLSLTIGDICKAYHSEEFQEIFNKLLRQGHILYQTEFVTKYGQFIPLEVNAHFFTWKGKPTIISIARDISERIAVQEALKESEERYRGLFEGIPVGIYRTTAEGLIIDANPAFVSLLGYDSREELTTINVSDLYLNPEDRLRWKTVIDEVGVVRSFETQLVRKDGAIIWVRENSHSVKDETGKVLYYQGSVEDITIRKKMEERLQASENRYRDIVENSEDFIFTHDSSGIILSVNRAFVKGLGLKSDSQMVGKSLEEFLSESSRKTFQRYLQRILDKGSDFGYFELKTATGKLRVVEYQNSVRSSGGKTPVIRSISRDVTEKITTQKALEEEKERLMVTLRNIADGVITTDDQGKIVLMNHAAHRLLGLEEEEATGKRIEEIFRIEDEQSGERVPCPVMEVLKTGETIVHDQAVRLVTADDFDRLITYSVAPLHDNQHRLIGVVLAFQDVSKLLTLEEELHKAQKLESLGILAGGIAHDFNNILTAILGNISLAKMAAEKDGNLPKRLAEAENAILRAQDLTKQLLTFARGGAPVKRAASIVDIVKEITEFALRGSKCQPEFHFTDSIWPVEVDRGQISQVINNLVINAAQAMPKGGVIRVECGNVEIDEANKENSRLMKPGKYVKISITDEGEGIPREHLPIIFDPYFTTREHGTGLGLATSHSIVKKHGGYIFVDSEIGVGSTFTIFLPANPDTKLECTQSQTSIEQGRGKILVMDDEEAILDIASQMLLRLGYEVVTAKDGEQVIELYRKELEKGAPFDAVIMDLTIRGGMGGKEAVKKLKNLDPNLKAIVSSGYFNDPVIANYKEFGFVECIPKPYNMESLSTILRKVLERTPVK